MQFVTLDDKKYYIHLPDYKIKWAGKSSSKFEFNCKKYFFYIWRNDIVLEEMLIRPCLHHKYRVDLVNISKMVENYAFKNNKEGKNQKNKPILGQSVPVYLVEKLPLFKYLFTPFTRVPVPCFKNPDLRLNSCNMGRLLRKK